MIIKRHNLKTKILAVALAAFGVAGIAAACGSDDSEPSPVTETTRRRTTTTITLRPTTTTLPSPTG